MLPSGTMHVSPQEGGVQVSPNSWAFGPHFKCMMSSAIGTTWQKFPLAKKPLKLLGVGGL